MRQQDELAHALSEAQGERAKAQSDVAKLSLEKYGVDVRNNTLEKASAGLKEQRDRAMADNEANLVKLKVSEEEIKKLEKKVEDLEKKYEKLKDVEAEKEEQRKHAIADGDAHVAKVRAFEEKIRQLEERVEDLERDNEKLKAVEREKEEQIQYVEKQWTEASKAEAQVSEELEKLKVIAKENVEKLKEAEEKLEAKEEDVMKYMAKTNHIAQEKMRQELAHNQTVSILKKSIQQIEHELSEAKQHEMSNATAISQLTSERDNLIGHNEKWAIYDEWAKPRAEDFEAAIASEAAKSEELKQVKELMETQKIQINELQVQLAAAGGDADPGDDSSDDETKTADAKNGKQTNRKPLDGGNGDLFEATAKKTKRPQTLAEELDFHSDSEDSSDIEAQDETGLKVVKEDIVLGFSRIQDESVEPVSASEQTIVPPTLSITKNLETQKVVLRTPKVAKLKIVPFVASEQIEPVVSPVVTPPQMSFSTVRTISEAPQIVPAKQIAPRPQLFQSLIGGIQQTVPVEPSIQRPTTSPQLAETAIHTTLNTSPIFPQFAYSEYYGLEAKPKSNSMERLRPNRRMRRDQFKSDPDEDMDGSYDASPSRIPLQPLITLDNIPVQSIVAAPFVPVAQVLSGPKMMTQEIVPDIGIQLGSGISSKPVPIPRRILYSGPHPMESTVPDDGPLRATRKTISEFSLQVGAKISSSPRLIYSTPATMESTVPDDGRLDAGIKITLADIEEVSELAEKKQNVAESSIVASSPSTITRTQYVTQHSHHNAFACLYQAHWQFFLLLLMWLGILSSQERIATKVSAYDPQPGELASDVLEQVSAPKRVPKIQFANSHPSARPVIVMRSPFSDRELIRKNWYKITSYILTIYLLTALIIYRTIHERSKWFHANEETRTLLTDMFAWRRNVNSPNYFSLSRWLPTQAVEALHLLIVGVVEGIGFETRGFRIPG